MYSPRTLTDLAAITVARNYVYEFEIEDLILPSSVKEIIRNHDDYVTKVRIIKMSTEDREHALDQYHYNGGHLEIDEDRIVESRTDIHNLKEEISIYRQHDILTDHNVIVYLQNAEGDVIGSYNFNHNIEDFDMYFLRLEEIFNRYNCTIVASLLLHPRREF